MREAVPYSHAGLLLPHQPYDFGRIPFDTKKFKGLPVRKYEGVRVWEGIAKQPGEPFSTPSELSFLTDLLQQIDAVDQEINPAYRKSKFEVSFRREEIDDLSPGEVHIDGIHREGQTIVHWYVVSSSQPTEFIVAPVREYNPPQLSVEVLTPQPHIFQPRPNHLVLFNTFCPHRRPQRNGGRRYFLRVSVSSP